MGSRTKYNEWVFETFNVFPFFVSTPWTTSTLAPSNILHSSSHIYPLHIVFTNIFITELVIELKKLLVHSLVVRSVVEPQSNRWCYKYIIYILIKLKKKIYIYIYIQMNYARDSKQRRGLENTKDIQQRNLKRRNQKTC